jgi:sugar lactone lactonase YvrE
MLSAGLAQSVPASAAGWVTGDVFVASFENPGVYRVFSNSGVLKDTIRQNDADPGLGESNAAAGCSFDPLGDLYTINRGTNRVVVFDDSDPHVALETIDTSAAGATEPNSIVFSSLGGFYVASNSTSGGAILLRYGAGGTLLQAIPFPAVVGGPNWLDLAADQQTIFYTSGGLTSINIFDLGTGTQAPDFSRLPAEPLFALRLLPPGDGSGGLLVANGRDVKRLDGNGQVVRIYTVPDATPQTSLQALALGPNGTSFWTADSSPAGHLYRFNVATGALELEVNSPDALGVRWMCVKGGFAAARDAAPPTTTTVLDPAPNAQGFNNASVTVTLNTRAVSGINQIQFSGTGAQTVPLTVFPAAVRCAVSVDCSINIPITAEGTTTLTFFATDKAGNAEAEQTLTIKIDKTAPQAVTTLDPTRLDALVTGTDANGATVALTSTVRNAQGELRTYTVTDPAGNRLVLKEQVAPKASEVTASIVSLQSCNPTCGAVVTPAKNQKKLQVVTNRDGSKTIEQSFSVGTKEVDAEFSSATNKTTIKTLVNGREASPRVTRSGLVLLQLVTLNGTVSIGSF